MLSADLSGDWREEVIFRTNDGKALRIDTTTIPTPHGLVPLMPDGVISYDDDVGYLRSVVHTLQHERPWTGVWLEPWAASLSLLSAGVYRAIGSFALAVQGVLVLCAGLAVARAS